MSGFGNNKETDVVNAYFGTGSITTSASIWIALCTSDPLDGAATAISAETVAGQGSYLRQESLRGTDWDITAGTATINTVLTYDMTGVASDTITHAALWETEAGSSDQVYIGSAIATTQKTFNEGDQLKIEAGSFTFTVD